MNIEQIRQKTAFQPNAVATQKQATRDFLRSLHKQYPISLTLTLKQSYAITNAYGTYTQTLTRDEARRIARHFTHKLNQQVFGSSAKRYGKGLKYLIVAEGERTHKNIHLHMAIGGLPSYVKWNELERLVRVAKQRVSEIDEQYKVDLVDSGWAEYITKELGKTDTDNVFWDLA
jgi:hypothetical protein